MSHTPAKVSAFNSANNSTNSTSRSINPPASLSVSPPSSPAARPAVPGAADVTDAGRSAEALDLAEHPILAVIGLGYIGLPTAAVFSCNGFRVIGVDVNDDLIAAVNRGEVPFVEPELGEVVEGSVRLGMLRAQREMPVANIYVVAVPTPFTQGYAADLTYVNEAADAIAPLLRQGNVVILESTSPPGTTEHLAARVLGQRPDLSMEGESAVHFAYCPERVLPGHVLRELVENSRIIGGLTTTAAELARDFYAAICQGELSLTDARTAELAKLSENAFRDVNIAFANELSLIADRLDIDVWRLIELANLHPRVNILQPGPGVGGHCIAVDPWFIVSSAPEESRLIRTAREVNDNKPVVVADRITAAARSAGVDTVVCLGLAFKPDIDDLRESPAVDIVADLAARMPDVRILTVEPHVPSLPATLAALPNVELAELHAAVEAASLVALLVDHTPFRNLNRALLSGKQVIDTRGTFR